jgi:predicted metal-dependent HD superfamily phosphohydrolase
MEQSSSLSRLDRARFQASWRSVGATSDAAFDILTLAYAEPHRFYHTARHVSECLAWCDRTRSLATHPDEVEIALFFHDLVYEPAAADNEAASAARFRVLAQDDGVDEASAARIANLIEATASRTHQEGDAALVVDMDLSILGAAPSRFAQYERDIRREFASFSDTHYQAGRALFLRSFLDRDRIYTTRIFAALLEAQARANLASALGKLRVANKEVDDV